MTDQFQNHTARTAAILRDWLKRMGVKSPARIKAALDAHQQWANEPRHVFSSTTNPAAHEADACVISQLSPDAKVPRIRIAVLEHRNARFHLIRGKLNTPELRQQPPLTLAHNLLNKDYLPIGEGAWEHDHRPLWFRETAVRAVAETHAEFALQKIFTATGLGPLPDNFSYSSQKSFYAKPLRALQQEEGRRIRKAYHQLFRAMNQNALRIMHKARTSEGWTYQWLCGQQETLRLGGDYRRPPAASAEAQRNRQQAMEAFPALIFMMRQSSSITAGLDRGDKLLPLLLNELNDNQNNNNRLQNQATAECVRQLFGKRPHDIDPAYRWQFPLMGNATHAADFHHDLPWISSLPREWRPSAPGQWQRFHNFYLGMLDWATLTGRDAKTLIRDFSALTKTLGRIEPITFKDDYTLDAKALQKALKVGAEYRQMIRTTMPDGKITPHFIAALGQRRYDRCYYEIGSDHKDFINRLGDQVILPTIIQASEAAGLDWLKVLGEHSDCAPPNGHISGRTTRLLFNNLSVPTIFRASTRWHAQVGQMERLTCTYNEPTEWPALLPEMRAPNGVIIRCLTNSQSLREEGEQMDHCVGGYSFRCTFKNSHILTLTAADGSWRTTIELEDQRDETLKLRQHVSYQNDRNLHPDATAAEHWLLEGINKRTIELDLGDIQAHRKARLENMEKEKRKAILLRVGFDPLNQEDTENAYQRWHKAVPDILPDANRARQLEARGIPAFIQDSLKRFKPA